MSWSSLPPAHKRAFLLGVAGYALLAGLTAGFVWFKSAATVDDWNSRIPHATAAITQDGNAVASGGDFSSSNSVPAPNAGAGDAEIAIVMTDLGMSDKATTQAISQLPPQVALAFSPYSPDLLKYIGKATSASHEALVLVPLEPLTYPHDDPGPKALLTRASDVDNTRALNNILTQSAGATGAMNFMGSAFLQDQKDVTALMTALQKNARFFVENPQGPESIAEDVAGGIGTPYLSGDVVLDQTASELALRQQLETLEGLARKNGYATGVAQPYPVTFSILKDWADSLARRGFKLVPVSALIKTKVQHEQASQKSGPQGGSQPATDTPAALHPEEQPPPLP